MLRYRALIAGAIAVAMLVGAFGRWAATGRFDAYCWTGVAVTAGVVAAAAGAPRHRPPPKA